jgi:type VI protein secretion system component VasK
VYLGIIGLAWMYVVILMAASEDSVAAGIGTFIFYGLLPLGVLLYLLATPMRRQRKQWLQEQAQREKLQEADAAANPDQATQADHPNNADQTPRT